MSNFLELIKFQITNFCQTSLTKNLFINVKEQLFRYKLKEQKSLLTLCLTLSLCQTSSLKSQTAVLKNCLGWVIFGDIIELGRRLIGGLTLL